MPHYDLNRMGARTFEHMIQALAKAEIGNGVRVYGSGKDGQRDASFRGPIPFPVGDGPTWDGHGVIQVKHLERPTDTTSDWRWFLKQVRDELRDWTNRQRLHSKKPPEYILFATNVRLSGTADTGGKDQFDQIMTNATQELGLKGWYAWDDAEIRAMLDRHTSIRQRYLEYLAVGDFLVQLQALLPETTALTAEQLARHAASELVNHQWVRTGDAGYADGSKFRLADIAIDLPCATRGRQGTTMRRQAARLAIQSGDRNLRFEQGKQGLVLVGGPGQGKSTLAQLVAHAYRISFLADTDLSRFGPKASEALPALRNRLEHASIPLPTRRRWPVVLELAKAGAALAKDEHAFSLLKHLSEAVHLGGNTVTPAALLDWMRSWPVCLILDGLDEVPDRRVRTALIACISSLLTELNAEEVDVYVVATTRPQGYHDDFTEAFTSVEVELLELTEAEALRYSEALTAIRATDDPDLAAQVTERLIGAVHERVTQRLMTTPLQVTIMTALAESAVDLPTDRYELFDRYYRAVYDRELAKAEVSADLKLQRPHIDHLHEQAGVVLHRRTATGVQSDASLSKSEVSRMLRKRLTSAGYEEAESETIAEGILRLATERLVMLVSRRTNRYEFEVRSLQEYMAARALTEGTDESILSGLSEIADSSHWRNVWLLAAGRVLRYREHLKTTLLTLIDQFDEKGNARDGALAADLYLDNLGHEFPAVRQKLLRSAATLFAPTGHEVPRQLENLADVGLHGSEREQEILLEALATLAKKNVSSLAAKYLYENRAGMTPLAKRARSTFTEGRKYIRA